MIRRMLFAALCLSAAAAAAPPLTTIQDVLYKADGTRFNGTLTISWSSFQASDDSTIVTQSTVVKVAGGILRVQLVPTASSNTPVYYTVTYNSDGRVQFQETWNVPASAQPVRVRDVRSTSAAGGTSAADTGSTSVPESAVVGLISDLAARPVKGAGLTVGRVVYVDALGMLESVTGNASDCLHVDGSSGACGSSATAFVDGDSPAGIVDGSNRSFTLSAVPDPSTSLAVFRNGVRQKAGLDYTANGNALTFLAVSTPQPGDILLASYREGGTSGTAQPFPSPQVLCSGTGTATTGTSLASIGMCTIPAGLLAPGDRVEIRYDLAHAGTTSGFTFEIDWGATAVTHRDAAAGDVQVTGRADASIQSSGAQLGSQSWGTVLTFSASVASAADAYTSGISVNFQGKLAQAGDTLTLANYTVVRLP